MACKKHTPGKPKPCCPVIDETCCIPSGSGSVPSISFDGQTRATAGIIFGSDPCCRVYTPFLLGGSYTRVKSPLIAFDERAASVTQETYAVDTEYITMQGPVGVGYFEGRAYTQQGELVPMCDNVPYLCHTGHQNVTERIEQNMFVSYRRDQLTVILFKAKAKVVSEGDTVPVCRWFVVTVMSVGGWVAQVNNASFSREFTATGDGCCVSPTELGLTTQLMMSDSDIFDQMESPFGIQNRQYIGVGFWSAKTFLTLPTGPVTFNAGETVTALDAIGNPLNGCMPLTNSATSATINTSNVGPFPFSWIPPTVDGYTMPGTCATTINFTPGYGDAGGCGVALVDDGTTLQIQSILPGNRCVGGGPLLKPAFSMFTDSVGCGGAWCVGGWQKKIKRDVLQLGLTSSHSSQNYTAQSIVIPGGSWDVTF